MQFSHSCPQTCTIIRLLWQGLSCILSCISPKKSPFLPQNGRFCFFSYLLCFLVSGQYFRYKHRPKSADKPACISLGYHHIAFSKINSKCFRPRERCVGSTPTCSANYGTAFFFGALCRFFVQDRILDFYRVPLFPTVQKRAGWFWREFSSFPECWFIPRPFIMASAEEILEE